VGEELGKMVAPVISSAIYGSGAGNPWSYIWISLALLGVAAFWVFFATPSAALASKLAEQDQRDNATTALLARPTADTAEPEVAPVG
jgi:hypothetical protein